MLAASLFQNQPNPFDKETTIRYSLPEGQQSGKIVISSLSGELLKAFVVNNKSQYLRIQANELPAGTYLYTLYAGNKKIDSRRMVLTH